MSLMMHMPHVPHAAHLPHLPHLWHADHPIRHDQPRNYAFFEYACMAREMDRL
jgi:hypothetical protein